MKDNENGKAEVCVVLACTKQENAITSVVKRKCFQSKMKNKHFNQECKLPITNDRALLKLETSNGVNNILTLLIAFNYIDLDIYSQCVYVDLYVFTLHTCRLCTFYNQSVILCNGFYRLYVRPTDRLSVELCVQIYLL